MWRFGCEETVYFPFIFRTLMAIKGWAPPLMGWETKGRCAAAGTASWDKTHGFGAVNHPWASSCEPGSGGFPLWRVHRVFPSVFWVSQFLLAPNPPR